MGWIEIVIGAVVLAFWIANNIREMQKAAAANAAPPAPPESDVPPGAARTPAEDLQEFIKEVRRRNEAEQPDKSSRDVLVEDPRQIEPAHWETPAPPKVKPKRKVRVEPTPAVVRTAEVTALSADFAKPSTAASPILMGVRRKAPSPVVADVVKLLKSPNGLSTAFLLREILSEPMCKRPPADRRRGI